MRPQSTSVSGVAFALTLAGVARIASAEPIGAAQPIGAAEPIGAHEPTPTEARRGASSHRRRGRRAGTRTHAAYRDAGRIADPFVAYRTCKTQGRVAPHGDCAGTLRTFADPQK